MTMSDHTPLATGSHGDDVKTLQEALNKNGATLKVDGVFGPETEKAVRTYQTKHALTVDGIVGPVTAKALAADG